MKSNTHQTLEFTKIVQSLSQLALCDSAKEKLLALRPRFSEKECRLKMLETTEAVKIMDAIGTPPLCSMKELEQFLVLAEKGAMLIPDQLSAIAVYITACKRMKQYLKRAETLEAGIAGYGGSLYELSDLFQEIDRSIRNGMVEDSASPALRDVRRRIENHRTAIQAKLESLLRSKKEWFSDGFIVTRNGRFVLPVKSAYKNQISGTVIDTSGTGSTCFIEPSAVRKLQEELAFQQIEEDNEVRRILYTLTALVDAHMRELNINRDCMETLDMLFAKGKLSVSMKARSVPVTTDRRIKIVKGRHPLLAQGTCVPLDFEMGEDVHGVIITGPNTGGKTVALKTVGLLSLMAQSGLHVPVGEGSRFCMHSNVLCDIGDGQSITENLSTFSAHMTNILSILQDCTAESLVLLDELGSGTDPAEGMGLAIAILEQLKKRDCLFLATTHYPEIKDFAAHTPNLINARMEFDRESLQPLYKLEMGEAGESCALYIARRLGFPEDMLERAYAEAYHQREGRISAVIPAMEFAQATPASNQPRGGIIQKEIPKKADPLKGQSFQMGDSVVVYPQKVIGIVYQIADEKGNVGVQIQGDKQLVGHKRIKLHTPASQLYPDNYDYSIIFDSVENRKARHVMDRRHDPNAVVRYDD